MARFIQGVVAKNNLMKQPMVVVNKGGGAGAEGFLEVKGAASDPHTIIITLSNLFTTPLGTGVPFNWKDLTPVGMLALDQFVLWVNCRDALQDGQGLHRRGQGRRRQDLQDGRHRLQAGRPDHHGGAGEADGAEEVHLRSLQGGGAVPTQLVGKHVNSTVNNPIEAVVAMEGGCAAALVPLRRQAQHLHREGHDGHGLVGHPDLQGGRRRHRVPDAARHLHAPRASSPEQVAFYVDLFKKVTATEDWKKFMENGAFNQTFMSGDEFKTWLESAEKLHYDLMKEAGFLARK